MSTAQDRVILHGQLHVTLQVVARCYHVEVAWIEKVYAMGLLGEGERVEVGVVIAAAQFDRVARIIRLHFHHGVGLESLPIWLDQST